jgi:hypothetical protein
MVMPCSRCGQATEGVELTPGAVCALCPNCVAPTDGRDAVRLQKDHERETALHTARSGARKPGNK